MVKNGKIKLIDFGFAFHKKPKRLMAGGTLNYIAPEILLGLEPTRAIDMWSFGCSLFMAYTTRDPFEGKNSFRRLLLEQERCLQKGYPKVLRERGVGEIWDRAHKKGDSSPGRYTLRSSLERYGLRKEEDLSSVRAFMSTLEKIFEFEPEKRLKPKEALQELPSWVQVSSPSISKGRKKVAYENTGHKSL